MATASGVILSPFKVFKTEVSTSFSLHDNFLIPADPPRANSRESGSIQNIDLTQTKKIHFPLLINQDCSFHPFLNIWT